MGDYTRLTLNVKLKSDTPVDVREILTFLTSDGEISNALAEIIFLDQFRILQVLDDPFFKCDRWSSVLSCSCVYLPSTCKNQFIQEGDEYRLIGSGSIKEYDDEYVKFLTWLLPYMTVSEGDVIGYTEFDLDKLPKKTFSISNGALACSTERAPARW